MLPSLVRSAETGAVETLPAATEPVSSTNASFRVMAETDILPHWLSYALETTIRTRTSSPSSAQL